jgi:hypothetical protein
MSLAKCQMSLALDNGARHSGVGKLHFLGSVQLSHCPQSPPKAWHMRQTFSDHIRTKKVCETAMMQAVLASYFALPGPGARFPRTARHLHNFRHFDNDSDGLASSGSTTSRRMTSPAVGACKTVQGTVASEISFRPNTLFFKVGPASWAWPLPIALPNSVKCTQRSDSEVPARLYLLQYYNLLLSDQRYYEI